MAAEYLVVVNVADGGDWHMRLVNKALYSTYRDCEDLGVGEEARLLMAQQAPAKSKNHGTVQNYEAFKRGLVILAGKPFQQSRIAACERHAAEVVQHRVEGILGHDGSILPV